MSRSSRNFSCFSLPPRTWLPPCQRFQLSVFSSGTSGAPGGLTSTLTRAVALSPAAPLASTVAVAVLDEAEAGGVPVIVPSWPTVSQPGPLTLRKPEASPLTRPRTVAA
ncbi:hypothetical protein GCM10010412_014180 [Nonomuraea recticatena]|uniref:Uncharacterized protein n=1 Tax=Nonomuraea recticatena TaxID=46178 RepID=A0ABP6DU94_9ACTN